MASYTPDFVLEDGRVLEIKGRLTAADRKKLVAVREANSDVEIYIGFQRPNNPIYKGSNTSCADWAAEHSFKWFDVKELEQWL